MIYGMKNIMNEMVSKYIDVPNKEGSFYSSMHIETMVRDQLQSLRP